MAKSSGSYLINQIERLLVGSTSGIKGVRYDISEKEAQDLIAQLQDEQRNIRPAEEMNPWERPTRPENLLLMALWSHKLNPEEAALVVRRKHNIPDNQMMTSHQTKELINRLALYPTTPGHEELLLRELDALPQDFTWARKIR